MKGILLLVSLEDKSVISIKVQTPDDRQQGIAIGEVHRELIGFYTFCLQQHTICLFLGKRQQSDIVRQEVGIRHLQQGIDMKRITPYGIYTCVRLRTRLEGIVTEGNHLTLLRKAEVTIGILQGIGTIGAWGNTLHHKMSRAVST